MIKKFLLIALYLILFIEIGHTLEFYGNFIQGHFIVGKTEPNSRVIIDKKKNQSIKRWLLRIWFRQR